MDGDEILPEQLRAVLRFSLRATSSALHTFEGPIDENNPAIKKLVQHILFSRRFVLTYYAVLAAAILFWSCLRQIAKLRKRKQQWDDCVDSKSTSSNPSSSSSTLHGPEDASLKDNEVDEITSLLGKTSSIDETTMVSRLYCHMRAFLVAQPKPQPALTAPSNTMPPNGTTIIVVCFLALNLFYLFYKTPLSRPMLFAFADRAGLMFVVNLPILYALAAKNNQPLKWLTGWSYEGLNLFHRRLGEWMTVAALLHGISMIFVWWILLRPFGLSLGWYLTRKIILIGLIALMVYIAIYVTSIGYVRQACYEAFLALHIFLQVAALGLLFFHHPNARPYVGGALAIWITDRITWRILASTRSFVANLAVAPDGETVLLFCNIPLAKSNFGGIKRGWRPGEHVFVSVPGLGWKHRFQAHPFTIASPAPPQYKQVGNWPLQLIIRAKDGFSKDLLEYARFHQHTRIYLDGPYGHVEALSAMRASKRVCLIAGGSGIAVTYPLAWGLQPGTELGEEILFDARTQYVNGRKITPQLITSGSLANTERFAQFWVRQKQSHNDWITLFPRQELQRPVLDLGRDRIPVVDLVTERFSTRKSLNAPSERPDMDITVREWVCGVKDSRIDRNKPICIVVSGPDTLVWGIRNTSARLIREGWKIEVLVEKFGW